jgi:uracil-DNA glycosylase
MQTKIMIVGEAFGKEEEEQGLPFVGASGFHLNQMLSLVGIERSQCYVTNVFNLRPEGNDVKKLCGPKADGIPGMPMLQQGKYVRREFAPELVRLYREVSAVRPTVLLALGASAAWAFLRQPGIKRVRGAAAQVHPETEKVIGWPLKIVPTYHPAAMMRDFTLRPIIISDLDKVRRESEYPELRLPKREIWVQPTFADLMDFEERYIAPSPDLSIDIETVGDQITCIGFAPTSDVALVVPIFDFNHPDRNYWRTLSEEILVWRWIKRVCALPKRVIFQNGMYDMSFLWRMYGITVPGASADTMLMHHSHQPEMEKSLGFLGTIYTDEAAWKFRRAKSNETVKAED